MDQHIEYYVTYSLWQRIRLLFGVPVHVVLKITDGDINLGANPRGNGPLTTACAFSLKEATSDGRPFEIGKCW